VRLTLDEKAYIALGSNIEPEHNLIRAAQALKALGTILATSRVYRNPAIAPESQPDYLNAAVLLLTDLEPLALRLELRQIETELGRVRSADKYAPRTIDLDLCLYGRLVLETESMTLPDPDITSRAHLAVTLAELNPDYVLPTSDESLSSVALRLRESTHLTLEKDLSRRLAGLMG
jgi:2-amino-4-hydroxy-6-hydroxymethyldihydropteridine diphosphokinase